MKVLVVCRSKKGRVAPYISQQVESLRKLNINVEYFLIKRKGPFGYLKAYPVLLKEIKQTQPDIIHAHYGFSGLLAVLQRKIPVITTFHGSDINYSRSRYISKMAIRGSAFSLFVSTELAQKANARKKYAVIPCGIDLQIFYPLPKEEARLQTGLNPDQTIILFSSSSGNAVKNHPLALAAIHLLNSSHNRFLSEVESRPVAPSQSRQGIKSPHPFTLLELKGYLPHEVNLLLNACDVALLTSKTEGSPNFIKEAMACNRPIVSTDAGDVRSLMEGLPGCFIADNNLEDVADKIWQALQFDHSMGALQRIIDRGMEIQETARKIIGMYEQVLKM